MHKIIYKYGTMFSGKSLDLIKTVKSYEYKDYDILILKPKVATRDGSTIKSRLCTESISCYLIDKNDSILEIYKDTIKDKSKSLVIIDEIQLCTEEQIKELEDISIYSDVICYGLMLTSYNTVFNSINKLLTIADEIKEIDSICQCINCINKATHNLLLIDNKPIYTDDIYKTSDKSLDEYNNHDFKYIAVCREHYKTNIGV